MGYFGFNYGADNRQAPLQKTTRQYFLDAMNMGRQGFEMKSKKGPSVFSEDVRVIGTIASDGPVEIFGQVEGDVRAGSLTVGERASVIGQVIAQRVVVRGRIEGKLRARDVQLAATGSVQGDIVHATLEIQSGAVFDGHCQRDAEPISDKTPFDVQASPHDGVVEELGIVDAPPFAPNCEAEAAIEPPPLPDLELPPLAKAVDPVVETPTPLSEGRAGKPKQVSEVLVSHELAAAEAEVTPPASAKAKNSSKPDGQPSDKSS